ncbi:tripartite tricarboxylate transporter substrate binding protein [Sporosarcina sp. E16_3]|uniref:tripartite tricarboxylate transporter substrate binding protein n=1 Tax=Sporosarcina sp. E16_3 TaxID=2789293 RepID=UPI001A9226B8|nr:tripartite tricarboxylate transporter substrate binding protein [Sporosarcina sp. E16_3]MBO0602580.1 tripartite tricarboxylate transporter substrate binding protein [Sporosarcina sp. E16_3]
MKKMIKKVLFGALLVGAVAVMGACSETVEGTEKDSGGKDSSSYPTKPIEIVVPAGAGGDTDLNTRTMAKYLEKELGTTMIITNVNGAGGTTGTKKVLDSKPDGYTVLSYHNSTLISKILGLVDYTYSDFDVAGMGVMDKGNAFVVNNKSEFKSLDDLIAFAKENPEKVTVATEVGSFTHLQLLAFEAATGTKFNIVDVGGASDKITALLGGRIDIIPTQLGLVNSYVESGDFRALGIMSDERLKAAPDVPTFKEQGVDLVMDKFFFWGFPKGTPEEIVDTFTKALEKVVANEEYQKEMEGFMVEPVYLNPAEANELMEKEDKFYTELNPQ